MLRVWGSLRNLADENRGTQNFFLDAVGSRALFVHAYVVVHNSDSVWSKFDQKKKKKRKITWSVYTNQWNENYLKYMFGFSVLRDAASHKNENASVEMGY